MVGQSRLEGTAGGNGSGGYAISAGGNGSVGDAMSGGGDPAPPQQAEIQCG